MQMVQAPESFDVIVTNNMFGDIVTDLGAALQGGLGVAGSANLHPGRTSMFEPVHGSAPKYAGTGKANPVGAILSTALMLETLGHRGRGGRSKRRSLPPSAPAHTTHDLGGALTTSEVGDLVAQAVAVAARSPPPEEMKCTSTESELIYDWNCAAGAALARRERASSSTTRRCATACSRRRCAPRRSSDKVEHPPPDLADSGSTRPTSACPAPARTSSPTSTRLAQEIVERQARARRQLRRAHGERRHPADRRDRAEDRHPDRGRLLPRLLADPPVRRGLGRWTSCCNSPATRSSFAVARGAAGDVRHRGHHPRRPEDLRALSTPRRSRRARGGSASPTPSATRRPSGDAEPGALHPRAWWTPRARTVADRLARPQRPRPGGRSTPSPRPKPAPTACTAPPWGSASGSATARSTCCW